MTRERGMRIATIGAACLAILLAGITTVPTQAAQRAHASIHSVSVPSVRVHSAAGSQHSCKARNKATGTLRISEGQIPSTLNPFQNPSDSALDDALFDALALYDNRLQLRPHLATAVPSVQNGLVRDGGRTIMWHLRKGMRWSDGQEITSADIRFGWRIGMDKVTGPYCLGFCDVIKRIDTPDRYTAVFHLIEPRPLTLCPCQMPPIWPTRWRNRWNGNAHKAAVTLVNDPSFNFLGPHFPTDGPFQVAKYVKGKELVLRPMKYYHTMSCGAGLARIVVRQYSSPAALTAAAAAGQVDVTWGWTMSYLGMLRRSTAYRTQVVPGFATYFLIPNLDPTYGGKPNPLANRNVRLALSLAIDRVRLTRQVYGVSQDVAQLLRSWNLWIDMPQLGLVQPYSDRAITGQWDPIAGRYMADTGRGQALADARTLLARTRWKDGFTLDFLTVHPAAGCRPCDTWSRMGGVAADWAKIGVTFRTTAVDIGKLCCGWDSGTALSHGAFQLSPFDVAPSVDPDEWRIILDSHNVERDSSSHQPAATRHTAGLRLNFAGVRDPVIDHAFAAAGDSMNPEARARSYTIVQQRVNKRAYYFPIMYRTSPFTIGPRAVHVLPGMDLGPAWAPGFFLNMHDWRVKGS